MLMLINGRLYLTLFFLLYSAVLTPCNSTKDGSAVAPKDYEAIKDMKVSAEQYEQL